MTQAKQSARISDRLRHRLQEALQQGTEVRIRLASSNFYGVPVHIDGEFVEILCLHVDETDETSLCERAIWLIRLSEIVAFSYPIDSWSKERLEALLRPSATRPDVPSPETREDSPDSDVQSKSD